MSSVGGLREALRCVFVCDCVAATGSACFLKILHFYLHDRRTLFFFYPSLSNSLVRNGLCLLSLL